ncbi:MAG: DegV family protein [Chloroflexota bacterium]|nr:DegV family protein [Chloroflexota bacterium]
MSFKKIRFVADSTCDIPPELVQQHKIGIVPCYINYNNDSYADDGSVAFREKFYADLPTMNPHPTTAAMPPAVAEKIIKESLEDADHVVIMSVSSKLSGVYNALRLGASSLPADKYTLIDSLSATMGLGFQVLIGIETAAATNDIKQVVDTIERVRAVTHVYIAPATIENMRRSGRVSWAQASIGALLQIKPLLDVHDGEVNSAGRVRTFKRAVEELVRFTHEQAPLDRMAIVYTNAPEGAHELAATLRDVAPSGAVPIIQVTPTLGTHVGPGGIGVVTISQKWRT